VVTSDVPTVVKAVVRFVPIVERAPMITTAISAAISPYSMAVAPSSLRMKAFVRRVRSRHSLSPEELSRPDFGGEMWSPA
jgi:hypothetical protein